MQGKVGVQGWLRHRSVSADYKVTAPSPDVQHSPLLPLLLADINQMETGFITEVFEVLRN